MNAEQKHWMRIAEIAKKLSISTRAIRFYEEEGLLHPTKNPENDYRLFSDTDVARIQTIVILREIGMSLRDIRAVLDEMDRNQTDTVAHYLEMQRSALYTKWIELSHTIRSAEYMIESFQAHSQLADQELTMLSGSLKRLQEVRETTYTNWDFDDKASTFDERVCAVTKPWLPYYAYETALNWIVELIDPEDGERGLELAVGTGNLANKLAATGAVMAGVDRSFEMLRQCRMKYPNIEVKLGNIMAAPFFDAQFDFVVTSYAFHLLSTEQQQLSLREMDRLLTPTGRICIADNMFLDEEDCVATLAKLHNDGNEEALGSIEQVNFPILAELVDWFVAHANVTESIRVNESVHVLFARKANFG